MNNLKKETRFSEFSNISHFWVNWLVSLFLSFLVSLWLILDSELELELKLFVVRGIVGLIVSLIVGGIVGWRTLQYLDDDRVGCPADSPDGGLAVGLAEQRRCEGSIARSCVRACVRACVHLHLGFLDPLPSCPPTGRAFPTVSQCHFSALPCIQKVVSSGTPVLFGQARELTGRVFACEITK